ncbi:unnamed protein product [Caenorhabditis sp. 36 PRJEB53466]|nr:unnamed protein product [Caenorhabditis sp. 36 PRJEB53466]
MESISDKTTLDIALLAHISNYSTDDTPSRHSANFGHGLRSARVDVFGHYESMDAVQKLASDANNLYFL